MLEFANKNNLPRIEYNNNEKFLVSYLFAFLNKRNMEVLGVHTVEYRRCLILCTSNDAGTIINSYNTNVVNERPSYIITENTQPPGKLFNVSFKRTG